MGDIRPLDYLEGLVARVRSIKVTDSGCTDIEFDEGMNRSCDLVAQVQKADGKVILIGNGGSAGIASHMAVDFWKNGGVKAVAYNDSSLLTCIGNDFGYAHTFEKPIEMFGEKRDLLIAISSSGRSENILNGVRAARAHKAKVITMSGFGKDNPLCGLGDYNFYVPSGAYGPVEVIHQALIHALLDIYMVRAGKLRAEDFVNG